MVDLTYSLGVAAWREQLMCERRSQRSIGRILDPRSATPQQRERAPGLSTSARRARKRLSRTPLGRAMTARARPSAQCPTPARATSRSGVAAAGCAAAAHERHRRLFPHPPLHTPRPYLLTTPCAVLTATSALARSSAFAQAQLGLHTGAAVRPRAQGRRGRRATAAAAARLCR